ncbi:MAG TPA: hypothetical protein VJV74_13445 [Terriglobia bacterium]|nr:hypothetical protein [Terriglobia bacterium]
METNPDTGTPAPKHETRDANLRRLIQFGVGLAVLTIFGLVVSDVVFHYFARHQTLGPPASPFENVRQLPPSPRLQVTPVADLDRYLAEQQHELTTYGWVDQKAGVVRIPIDRAMDLLLQKGLPVRNSSTPAGQIQPGEVQETVPKGYTPE